MNKIFTLTFLLLNSILVFAQKQGFVTVSWTETKPYSYGNYSVNIPQFNPENLHFDSSTNSLTFIKRIKLNHSINETSLKLSNIVLQSISQSQLGALDLNKIPSKIQYSIRNNIARNEFFGEISITPIVKEGNEYKKLISFDYFIDSSLYKTKASFNNSEQITNSVLATGNWYRFYVQKSGVYKITKSFLESIGLNTNNLDPRKIKIFGNGGRMVPLSNETYYPMDLIENSIQVIGENDGIFDNQDYILFYAEGMDNWNEENKTHLNLYADKSYYYVTVDENFGKRIPNMLQPVENETITITQFDDYSFHEVDNINIAKLGRIWYGESFGINNEQEFTFNFPARIISEPVEVKIHTAIVAYTPTNFSVKLNNLPIGNISYDALTSASVTKAFEKIFYKTLNSLSNDIAITLTYNNGGVPNSQGYLDYISLKAKSELKGINKQYRFQFNQAESTIGIGKYIISNASNVSQIWDITDIYNVTKVDNPNQDIISFKSDLGEIKKYLVVDSNDYYSPLKDSNNIVLNQNLKGLFFDNTQNQFEDIDYLIITPNFLKTQAEKLAAFHKNYSNLNVKVATLEKIYNEFSSGKQDIAAIRNFIKYVYFNASSPEKRIKYVNLFGDASFDFKDRIPNNTNIVPIFQALSSYTETESSFASDDFFGCMDSNEGNPISFFSGIDIAVGRMIVSTTQQAEDMVNKVIEYHDPKSFGSWRNDYVAISDDSDKFSDNSLQASQNNLADEINSQKPFFNVEKILLDSYTQETSSGGNRYPKARKDLFAKFEKGALVFNYLGHGGEDGLSGERIWEKADGENLKNQYRYPLFVTITCEFSKFDNPYRPTAGESTYLNPKGGAIAMITTIRSIGQVNAEIFNNQLASYLFSYESNEYPSIAEALRLAKNVYSNSSTNVVCYLGDPALMLSIPKPKIVLTKVNDVNTSEPIEDFKSLSLMKITGEVRDENDNLLTNYNGTLSANIFDKNTTQKTLNNDGYSPSIDFISLGETIFRSNASVINGKFEFSFVVPKDIRIPLGNGKISFYAKSNQSLTNQTGYNTDIKIGGINTNATTDSTGPSVKLYMNNENFVNGGITNNSPFLLAILEDEHGINTASGIGHEILGFLDGDDSKPFLMNDYFESDIDNYKKGKVYFPLRNLTPGLHTLTFKAWDVYNNPTTAEIQFVVTNPEKITLSNVLNYPNPFVNYTEFWFTHNRPFEPLEVQIQVMTITGKVVWTKNQTIETSGFISRDITWDGKDDFGDRIGKGVYIYRLTVKSTITNQKTEKIEKLVIL